MESKERRGLENKIEILESEVRREALIYKGREGLQAIPFDPALVRNQEQFERTVDDVGHMAQVHAGFAEEALGVRETTTRRFNITVNGETIQVNEAIPTTINKWLSYPDMPAQFLTQDQAKNTPHAGKTALDWATRSGKVPERVVRAGGYYYPATNKDVIVPTDLKFRR